MRKSGIIKFIITFVIIIIIFTYFENSYAAINNNYIDVGESTVDENTIAGTSVLSEILRPIAFVVYCLGQMIELLLTQFAGFITEGAAFPWADMVIFNEVPLLDINFIDPSPGTLISDLNTTVINPLYFTILSMAIVFFSIAVLLMAIKILVTTIAEEKAKYKQQLLNWLMGIILIFTLHYFMAFIFYLNENLVRVASSIASERISSTDQSIGTLSDLYRAKAVDSYETTLSLDRTGIAAGQQAVGAVTSVTQVTTDIHIDFCIMYTIFVAQSILFFFAYIRRFFFVIILALLGPIIVVYDFFSKAVLQ